MKKIQLLIMILLLVNFTSFSQSKTYSNGNLIYTLPNGWNQSEIIKKGKGISYGGSYFDLGESIQFSVIEMQSPPNKTIDLITESDFRGAINNMFHPQAIFEYNSKIKYIDSVKTKYLEAFAYVKGKKVYSLNYVTVYKGKVMFIQGILNSKNMDKAKKIVNSIIKTIKFK
jgi:hypothetical protein